MKIKLQEGFDMFIESLGQIVTFTPGDMWIIPIEELFPKEDKEQEIN